MRRSKSNPSRYVKHYKKVSNRRMSNYDSDEEMSDISPSVDPLPPPPPAQPSEPSTPYLDSASILSPDLLALVSPADAILPSKRKKQKTKEEKAKEAIVLTPHEQKQALKAQKRMLKKRKAADGRKTKKDSRQKVYDKLSLHAISDVERGLLKSSSRLGVKDSKKETILRLKKKQDAGLQLDDAEADILSTKVGGGGDSRMDDEEYNGNNSSDDGGDVDVDVDVDDDENSKDNNNNNNNNNNKQTNLRQRWHRML